MKRIAVIVLLACGPGPTSADAPVVAPTATTKITPTKAVHTGPDCATRAMEKLATTITDAGMRSDLDASNAIDEVEPANFAAVLQELAQQLTACNPQEIEGCAYVTANVEQDGSISATETFVSDGLPSDVLDCIRGVLKDARFAAVPKAGRMTVPVTFTRTR